MKRKSVGIAIVIAALAVLVNVFALQSATVKNTMTLKVTNTTTSLIAITGAGADDDVNFDSTSGYAQISLPDGANGLQPNSSYTFYPVFNVVNNSGASRNITLTSSSLPTGVTISFVDTNGDPIPVGDALAAAGTLAVGIKVDLGTNAALGNAPLTINVVAE